MKRIIIMLALVLGVAGASAWLVHFDAIRPILIPEPGQVVQNFISAESSGHHANARQFLIDDLQQEYDTERLRSLDQMLQRRWGGYRLQPEGSAERSGRYAKFTARIQTDKRGEETLAFELERDPRTELWKISSLDELVRAAGSND